MDTPATGSTAFLRHLSARRKRARDLFRSDTKRWPHSWRALLQNSPGKSAFAWRPAAPAQFTLLNGLYDAKMDHAPVLAIVGQQARSGLGSFYQQEVDLANLFKDVSEYVQQISVADQVRHCIDTAMRMAMSRKGVATLIFPNDLQEEDAVESPPRKHGVTFSGVGYRLPNICSIRRPDFSGRRCTKQRKESGNACRARRTLPATDDIITGAETLGAGVAKALLGKAAVPDTLPFVTGSIGLLGTKPSWDMMMDCDSLLVVGSSFPYSEFLPREGQARGVQIDIEARMLSLRYPMEVSLQGDAKLTLQKLLPKLERKTDRSWRESIEKNIRQWWDVLRGRAMSEAHPINPQRVFWELKPQAARQLHSHSRFRVQYQLVGARPEDSTRDDGDALGQPGHDGARNAIRSRRQIRFPRPRRNRHLRRRRRCR